MVGEKRRGDTDVGAHIKHHITGTKRHTMPEIGLLPGNLDHLVMELRTVVVVQPLDQGPDPFLSGRTQHDAPQL
jgi:hypothetical protein